SCSSGTATSRSRSRCGGRPSRAGSHPPAPSSSSERPAGSSTRDRSGSRATATRVRRSCSSTSTPRRRDSSASTTTSSRRRRRCARPSCRSRSSCVSRRGSETSRRPRRRRGARRGLRRWNDAEGARPATAARPRTVVVAPGGRRRGGAHGRRRLRGAAAGERPAHAGDRRGRRRTHSRAAARAPDERGERAAEPHRLHPAGRFRAAEARAPAEARAGAEEAEAARPRTRPRAEARRQAVTGETIAGRYVLERPLGHGAMAVVDLARDSDLDRPVALKRLAENLARDDELRARFLREGRLAARLSHPNVVRVYDVGEDGERPFIAMEYVDGETLAELVARSGPRPPREAAELGIQICRGLAAVHDAGLVHRDVKPQNLLLGRDGRLRLGDFGIAFGLDATRLTTAGTVLGTAAYLAPEQARGEEVTAAADLYGAGAVLYELITGRPPRT